MRPGLLQPSKHGGQLGAEQRRWSSRHHSSVTQPGCRPTHPRTESNSDGYGRVRQAAWPVLVCSYSGWPRFSERINHFTLIGYYSELKSIQAIPTPIQAIPTLYQVVIVHILTCCYIIYYGHETALHRQEPYHASPFLKLITEVGYRRCWVADSASA
jgi:hypothetical protein